MKTAEELRKLKSKILDNEKNMENKIDLKNLAESHLSKIEKIMLKKLKSNEIKYEISFKKHNLFSVEKRNNLIQYLIDSLKEKKYNVSVEIGEKFGDKICPDWAVLTINWE